MSGFFFGMMVFFRGKNEELTIQNPNISWKFSMTDDIPTWWQLKDFFFEFATGNLGK